ncbi:MAG TPA: D-alanyl-D-alanine carboxypeptidase/D-alanyl-D-alanine-endopeptidase [Actinobacteria bacterium]|nr:D-alanyl-D-alanine carboxypeptidase/D-alanyl-D-alanine-endopeptidase [Actinomycetota bacterium]
MRSAIGRLVAQQLGRASVVVLDPVSGTTLLDVRGSRSRIPASTAKLATAAAALDVLGPDTRLATTAHRDDRTVYLVGGGDPTLVRARGGDPDAGGRPSLTALAEAVAADYGTQTSLTVVYDASAFAGPGLGPGWGASYPRLGVAAPVSALVVDDARVRPGATARVNDPARQAGEVFAALLEAQGLKVRKVRKGELAEGAREIARVESATIADIVQRTLTDSENNFAEALAHLVGGRLLQDPSFSGGARATTQALQALGLDVDGLTLADGSGLSRQNRIPARLLADLLAASVSSTDPELVPMASGLAVAGLTGTLADRFSSAATKAGRGFVHAKTGTLTGVSSLAGTVLDAEGRTLVFAMIDDRVRSLAGVRSTMDVIASTLATCGCD